MGSGEVKGGEKEGCRKKRMSMGWISMRWRWRKRTNLNDFKLNILIILAV